LIRVLVAVAVLAPWSLALFGCGPSYSPDTYASNAAQQAAKVEAGVVAGVRPVQISAQGTVGGVAGAAAGGVAGSQVGAGPTSAFAAIGGSLVGGIAGVATEHLVGDTNGFEYIVRKANGDMISVAQKEAKPLWVGEKVLVIAGPQARVVPDYTVPFEEPPKTAAKPGAPAQPAAAEATHPAAAGGSASHATEPEPAPPLPPATVVAPQVPEAFGSPSTPPPAIIIPPGQMPSTAAPTASVPPPAGTSKP
jgi:outer membrane lipoprotein SlyB